MSTESAILNKQKNIFDKCIAKTNALELSFLRARPCCLFRIPGRPQIDPKLGVDHILERYNEYTTAQIEKSCAKKSNLHSPCNDGIKTMDTSCYLYKMVTHK